MTRMNSRMPLAGLAAAALLALTLAGCTSTDAPASDTGSSTGSSTDDSSETSTDSGTDAALVTLPGSGDYTVGVTAPIGGYSLKGDPAEQPDGCTWALEDADGNIQFQDQGTTVFITEENKFFQTSGCPDWVQFE